MLGADWTLSDIERAADYLGLDPDEFLKEYLKGEETGDGIEYRRWVSPCPFLTDKDDCEIYPVRPFACRLYPLKTKFGTGGVVCPAFSEMGEVIDRISKDFPHVETNHYVRLSGESSSKYLADLVWNVPSWGKWKVIKKRYIQTGRSFEEKKLFFRLNEKVREESSI